MSVLGEVFFGLEVMSLTQLLLAFVGCAGYQLGQGGLVSARGRHVAWFAAAGAAGGFVILASEWMHAAMLIAFAVAGMGVFTMAVWATCRLIGTQRMPAAALPGTDDPGLAEAAAAATAPRARLHRPVASA